MADDEEAQADPATQMAGDIAGLLFEVRIASTAVQFGIQTLRDRTEPSPMREELAVLHRLASQNCDALEALQKVITDHLTRDE